MGYETLLYRYFIRQDNDQYLVVRDSWLWGLPVKFLNRYGEFTSVYHYFDNPTTAEIRLKKFLQNEGGLF